MNAFLWHETFRKTSWILIYPDSIDDSSRWVRVDASRFKRIGQIYCVRYKKELGLWGISRREDPSWKEKGWELWREKNDHLVGRLDGNDVTNISPLNPAKPSQTHTHTHLRFSGLPKNFSECIYNFGMFLFLTLCLFLFIFSFYNVHVTLGFVFIRVERIASYARALRGLFLYYETRRVVGRRNVAGT